MKKFVDPVQCLSVGLWAETALVRDQVYLPSAGSSDQDILLGRRALDTNATTAYGVRLSYSFGSIYNNVVNNRLDDSGFTRIF